MRKLLGLGFLFLVILGMSGAKATTWQALDDRNVRAVATAARPLLVKAFTDYQHTQFRNVHAFMLMFDGLGSTYVLCGEAKTLDLPWLPIGVSRNTDLHLDVSVGFAPPVAQRIAYTCAQMRGSSAFERVDSRNGDGKLTDYSALLAAH